MMQKKVVEILPMHAMKLSTINTSNETTSTTNTASTPATSTTTTRSNDTYVYGIGMLAVLAIGVCVYFTYNNFP